MPLPEGDKELNILLRRTMIPWFAGIDPETGTARRNVSARNQLPPETLPIVDALKDHGLLTSDGNMIEPAHEALLREWQALDTWLVADHEKLITLEALRRAAANWQGKGRHKNYLDHRAGRLDEAERLADRPDLWRQLGPDDRDYLTACRAVVERQAFLRKAVAVFLIGITLFAGFSAWKANQNENTALQSQADALALLALSEAENNPSRALQIILGIWPRNNHEVFPDIQHSLDAIETALRRTLPQSVLSTGDQDPIRAIAVSQVNSVIIGAGHSGKIYRWSSLTHQTLGEPVDSGSEIIWTVAASPTENQFVVAGNRGFAQRWNTLTGNPVGLPLSGISGTVVQATYSRDGRHILLTTATGPVQIFNATDGSPMPSLEDQLPSNIRAILVSAHEELVVGGNQLQPATMRNLDIVNGAVRSLPVMTGEHQSLAFSNDARLAAFGGEEGSIWVVDLDSNQIIATRAHAHSGRTSSLVFLPGDGLLASLGSDGRVKLWHPAALTPTGLELWSEQDWRDGRQLFIQSEPQIALDRSGFVTLGSDGSVRVWGMPPLVPMMIETVDARRPPIRDFAYSSETGEVLSIHGDGVLLFRDENDPGASRVARYAGEFSSYLATAISPDGSLFAHANDHGEVVVRATGNFEGEIYAINLPFESGINIMAIFISPDKNFIAIVPEHGQTIVHSRRDNRSHEIDSGVVNAAFSDESFPYLVAAFEDGSIGLFEYTAESARFEQVAREDHGSIAFSFAFPDNHPLLLSGGEDGSVQVWSAPDLELLGSLRASHIDRVVGMLAQRDRIFSSDGNSILVHDILTRRLIATIENGSGGTYRLAASQSEEVIFAAGFQGELSRWLVSLPSGNLFRVACHYLPRYQGSLEASFHDLSIATNIENLNQPNNCDTYAPPLPPEFRQ